MPEEEYALASDFKSPFKHLIPQSHVLHRRVFQNPVWEAPNDDIGDRLGCLGVVGAIHAKDVVGEIESSKLTMAIGKEAARSDSSRNDLKPVPREIPFVIDACALGDSEDQVRPRSRSGGIARAKRYHEGPPDKRMRLITSAHTVESSIGVKTCCDLLGEIQWVNLPIPDLAQFPNIVSAPI